jgi:hypothetical protein
LPRVGRGDVIRRLQQRLETRLEIGVRRYGRPLQLFNGRDPFRDHEEELLDQHVYAEQIRLEYHALIEAVRVLARLVRGWPGAGPLSEAEASALALGEVLEELHGRG